MDIYLDSHNITDQKTLYKLETYCTQEEPAACIAACPLHINARLMAEHISKNEWEAAYLLFSKTIPFVQTIAHACDAPCQNVCKRKDIGGSIQIQKLELAVIKRVFKEPKAPLFLPKRTQTVAIIGGGLKGMTAAHDLSKKGYKVTIFEAGQRLGGHLWQFDSDILPEEAIENDIQTLLKFPVIVNYEQKVLCNTVTNSYNIFN